MASSNVTDPQHNLSKVPAADETTQASHDDEKQSIKNGLEEEDEVVPSLDEVQPGVQAIEAITISWTKPWLITAYACFWCLYCVNAFQSSITGNLSPYILSDFSEAPLVTVIYTVSSALAGALLMPIARMLNLWDRGNGFLVMVTIALLGLIISAACTNVAGYAAAQVFYSVGFQGLIFCVDVITIDTSTLRNRGLAYAFTSSPYIISAFAGPKAAEGFNDANWRWGYGAFCIILPVVAAPLYLTLLRNKRKAKADGLLKEQAEQEHKTPVQWLVWFFNEFDLFGVILLGGGLAVFLLPFIIAGSAEDQWSSSHIVAMLVVGFLMLVAFPFWECYGARRPFIPISLLTNRTLVGTCLLDMTYTIAYYCWAIYFSEYLQVVYNRSLASAGYIVNIFDVVNGVWLFGVGLLISRTRRFRWLYFCAVPMYLLFEALLIYFRGQGTGIGFIIMCQIFMAIAGGTLIICNQVSVLSVAGHQDAASALAMLNVFGTIGSAVGSTISGAIWTQLLPKYLQQNLPAETVDSWEDIYESLDVQLSYPVGDATRTAIATSYEQTQQWMITAGTIFMAFGLILMFVIRDVKLDRKQVKGIVF